MRKIKEKKKEQPSYLQISKLVIQISELYIIYFSLI